MALGGSGGSSQTWEDVGHEGESWPAGVVQYAERVQYVSLFGKLTVVHRGIPWRHSSGF